MKYILLGLTVLLLLGCDYVPNTVFEIETTDGDKIKLMCPVVDPSRSKFTYLIDNECRVIEWKDT